MTLDTGLGIEFKRVIGQNRVRSDLGPRNVVHKYGRKSKIVTQPSTYYPRSTPLILGDWTSIGEFDVPQMIMQFIPFERKLSLETPTSTFENFSKMRLALLMVRIQ